MICVIFLPFVVDIIVFDFQSEITTVLSSPKEINNLPSLENSNMITLFCFVSRTARVFIVGTPHTSTLPIPCCPVATKVERTPDAMYSIRLLIFV